MLFYQHQCLLQYPSFQAQEVCLNLAFLQSSELASALLHFARADPSHSRWNRLGLTFHMFFRIAALNHAG
ncbi:hypothetical protein BEN74_18090 [Acinetobacter sp. WCHAc010034]|nr:hypothetical protein BEN74_18090 [Acinetobacter sp. WCHAc010034]